jgi:beta-lactamase regulating signal transducer with metallopeptidase domain
VRVDTANRSFLALLGVALAPYLLIGLAGCGVLSLAVYRLAADGPGDLLERPAGWAALAFLAITALGAALGLRSAWRQLRATRQLRAFVAAHRVPAGGRVAAVAHRARIRRVELIDVPAAYSFTYGLVFPSVVITRGLADGLADDELEAVLAHERYHVANLDPLKVVAARALSSALFFLPALRALRSRYLAARELAADRRAVRRCGRTSLAGALYRVVAGPAPASLGAAAAIGGTELLDVRLAQLEEGTEPALPAISRISLAVTALGLVLMVVGVVATAAVLGSEPLGPGRMGGGGPADVAGALACGALFLVGATALYVHLAGRRR